MSILDKLANVTTGQDNSRCRMCVALETVDDADRAALITALSAPVGSANRVTDRQLSELLKSEGFDISQNTIFRHRQNHGERYV